MCGIVGIINKTQAGLGFNFKGLFEEMLICSQIRGKDSTGVFGVTEQGNVRWAKLASHPYNLLNSNEYATLANGIFGFGGKVIVGHNRKATSGAITNENAHPFIHENIILVHNGHISNIKTFISKKEATKNKIEVDSHACTFLFAKENPLDVLPKMLGAYTLVWYDINKKEINMCKNDKRPLAFWNTKDHLYFASEIEMLEWLVPRYFEIDKKSLQAAQLKNYSVTTFNVETNQLTNTEYEPPKPVVYSIPIVQGKAFVSNPAKVKHISHYQDSIKQVLSNVNNNLFMENTFPVLNKTLKQAIPFYIVDFCQEDLNKSKETAQVWEFWGEYVNNDDVRILGKFFGDEKSLNTFINADIHIGIMKELKLLENKQMEVYVSRACAGAVVPGNNTLVKEWYDAKQESIQK